MFDDEDINEQGPRVIAKRKKLPTLSEADSKSVINKLVVRGKKGIDDKWTADVKSAIKTLGGNESRKLIERIWAASQLQNDKAFERVIDSMLAAADASFVKIEPREEPREEIPKVKKEPVAPKKKTKKSKPVQFADGDDILDHLPAVPSPAQSSMPALSAPSRPPARSPSPVRPPARRTPSPVRQRDSPVPSPESSHTENSPARLPETVDLEQVFRDAKQAIWNSKKTVTVAPRLLSAIDAYGIRPATKIVEDIYDQENAALGRLDRALMPAVHSDKWDHWFNELDEAMAHVGLKGKPLPARNKELDWLVRAVHGWEDQLSESASFTPDVDQLRELARKYREQRAGEPIPSWLIASEPRHAKKVKKWLQELHTILDNESMDEEDDCKFVDKTGIYKSFKGARRALRRFDTLTQVDKERLDKAVEVGVKEENFKYVRALLVRLRECQDAKDYDGKASKVKKGKRVLDRMLEVAEKTQLNLIREDVNVLMNDITEQHQNFRYLLKNLSDERKEKLAEEITTVERMFKQVLKVKHSDKKASIFDQVLQRLVAT